MPAGRHFEEIFVIFSNTIKSAIGFFLVLVSCSSFSQIRPEIGLEEYCKEAQCRENYRLLLDVNTVGLDDIDRVLDLYWPPVFDDVVLLLPEDEIYVEASLDSENDALTNLRYVDEIVNPEQTLTFALVRSPTGMTITINNPFELPITYNVEILDFTGEYSQLSGCPVDAKSTQTNKWPIPIPELAIFDLTSLSATGSNRCTWVW